MYNSYEYSDDVRQSVNRFYEHINGEGMSFTLNSGEIVICGNPWNDRISSVRVAPKTLVILYTHINYGHPVKILENWGNTPALLIFIVILMMWFHQLKLFEFSKFNDNKQIQNRSKINHVEG